MFILADDLGWADTTLDGHTDFYKAPNIERLAKRGMAFTRAYAASPLCSPTRNTAIDPAAYHPENEGKPKDRSKPKPRPKAKPKSKAKP